MVGCRVYGADGCCSFVSGGGRIDVGRIVVGINRQARYIFAALVYRYAASGEILSESLEMLLMLLRRGYRDNDEIAFSTYGVSAVGHIGNDADQFISDGRTPRHPDCPFRRCQCRSDRCGQYNSHCSAC